MASPWRSTSSSMGVFHLGSRDTLWRQVFRGIALHIDGQISERDMGEFLSAVDESSTDSGLHRCLMSYIHSGCNRVQASFAQVPIVSGGCDESNIKGLCLSSGALVMPDNSAFWLPSQVANGIVGPFSGGISESYALWQYGHILFTVVRHTARLWGV